MSQGYIGKNSFKFTGYNNFKIENLVFGGSEIVFEFWLFNELDTTVENLYHLFYCNNADESD